MTLNEIQSEINTCKILLEQTDYLAIKFAEGEISEEEYSDTKEKRKQWRQQINVYEKLLEGEINK